MMKETMEYDRIAEQVAASLRKFLPELGRAGGLESLAVRVPAPLGGGMFPGNTLSRELIVAVHLYPEPSLQPSK